MYAAGRGDTVVAETLLAHGADPNLQDNNGSSALMEAVTTNHNRLIGTLLEYRADPTLTDGEGHTAADLAKASGNQEAVTALVRH